MSFDLVLLHPPSVYDFRRRTQFRGPISDVIPSSSVFEMYPIGMTSIAEYLERFGMRVKIVNLAARMLHRRSFDVEKKIRGLEAAAFGIGLHWLPHAQGSLEIAKLVRKWHPQAPVIFGGLSATYYRDELLELPFVDFVVSGDSTEGAVLALMRQILSGERSFAGVPNLGWKERGRVVVNPLAAPPEHLDDVTVPAYRYAIRSVFRTRSLLDVMPYQGWLSYPLTGLLTTRGCTLDCSVCGGSRSAYALHCGRRRRSMRSPARLLQDLHFIERFSRAPVFVIGDIRQGGVAYVQELLEGLRRQRPRNEMVFELFREAGEELYAGLEQAVPRYSLEITLESGDEEIRRENGKFACSNQEVIRTLRAALAHGARKIDIFFMVGLPRQTPASALRNIAFCEEIHQACGCDARLCYFVAPLAPFLDPGSRAFEAPEAFGVRRLATTLAEHAKLLEAPSWEFMLNYETTAMTRRQIVESTAASVAALNDFKLRYGLMDTATHQRLGREIGAMLRYLATVREAQHWGKAPRPVPGEVDFDQESERTRGELRWKLRRRYAGLWSLAGVGAELAGEAWRLRRARPQRWEPGDGLQGAAAAGAAAAQPPEAQPAAGRSGRVI